MTDKHTAGPCSHCLAPNPSVKKKSGTAGRVTRTPWHHETVACKKCNIEVSARTPGNAIVLWNRAYAYRVNSGETP